MKNINFKKIGLGLEILSFVLFTVPFIMFLLKFLRSEGILEITTATVNIMIKISLICIILLVILLLLTLITRILAGKFSEGEIVEEKIVIYRTVFACIIFIAILSIAFYYLCLKGTDYSVFEFIKTL